MSQIALIGLNDAVLMSTLESQIAKAAYPLALIWGNSRPNTEASSSTTTSLAKNSFLQSPYTKCVKEENEVLSQDFIEIVHGNSTSRFQAFIAKNGRSSIPHQSSCISIVTHKRSVDFFVEFSENEKVIWPGSG